MWSVSLHTNFKTKINVVFFLLKAVCLKSESSTVSEWDKTRTKDGIKA